MTTILSFSFSVQGMSFSPCFAFRFKQDHLFKCRQSKKSKDYCRRQPLRTSLLSFSPRALGVVTLQCLARRAPHDCLALPRRRKREVLRHGVCGGVPSQRSTGTLHSGLGRLDRRGLDRPVDECTRRMALLLRRRASVPPIFVERRRNTPAAGLRGVDGVGCGSAAGGPPRRPRAPDGRRQHELSHGRHAHRLRPDR